MLVIPIVQITRPASRRPLRSELRQQPRDLCAIDPVSSLVRTGSSGEFNTRVRHCLLYDLCDFPNAVVFSCDADVEYLIVNGLDRRLERRDKCSADVLNMNDRTP